MIERPCPGKVNLVLNILGKRADGFHELETILQPLLCADTVQIEEAATGRIHLTSSDPALPVDERNLVYRAAQTFLATAKITAGLRIHLDKVIPLSSSLGGGSSDAANTL